MSRLTVPLNLKGKPLYDFLVKNKASLIATKKAGIKYTASIVAQPSLMSVTKVGAVKSMQTTEVPDDNSILVKVSCNAAWWCDEALDVLTDKCYDKSIADRGVLIPHIADHIHTSTNHVGDVKAVYTQKVSLKDLGIDMDGTTTAAIMETMVRKDYNYKTWLFYSNGKINQHSIGLIYVSIGMCINDKDYVAEFELWNKYYDKVINKDLIDEVGYFWIVPEIKWIENSCVLLACNVLTPTLETSDTSKSAGIDATEKGPSTSIDEKSMVICPNCQKKYDRPESKDSNCPGCGQYVSEDCNAIESPTFELLKAIKETRFI